MDWRYALIVMGCSSFWCPQVRSANLHRSINHRSERMASFVDTAPGSSFEFGAAKSRIQSDIANLRKSLNQPSISDGIQGIQTRLEQNIQSNPGPRNQQSSGFNNRDRPRVNSQENFRVQAKPPPQFTSFNSDRINRVNNQEFTAFNSGVKRPSSSLDSIKGNFQNIELHSRTPQPSAPRVPVRNLNTPSFAPPQVSPVITTSIHGNVHNRHRVTEETFAVFSDKELVLPRVRQQPGSPAGSIPGGRQQAVTEDFFAVFSDKEFVLPGGLKQPGPPAASISGGRQQPGPPAASIPGGSRQQPGPLAESAPEPDLNLPVNTPGPEIDLRFSSPTTQRILPQPILPGPVDLSQSSQGFQVEDPANNPEIPKGFDVIDLANIDLVTRSNLPQPGSRDPDAGFLEPVPAVPGLPEQSTTAESLEDFEIVVPQKNSIEIEDFLV